MFYPNVVRTAHMYESAGSIHSVEYYFLKNPTFITDRLQIAIYTSPTVTAIFTNVGIWQGRSDGGDIGIYPPPKKKQPK